MDFILYIDSYSNQSNSCSIIIWHKKLSEEKKSKAPLKIIVEKLWWARCDSNAGPHGYQPCAPPG